MLRVNVPPAAVDQQSDRRIGVPVTGGPGVLADVLVSAGGVSITASFYALGHPRL